MPLEHDPNRCRADEREHLGPGAAPKKPRRKSDPAPPKAPTRLYSNDVKQSIFEAMHGWRMDGSPKGESLNSWRNTADPALTLAVGPRKTNPTLGETRIIAYGDACRRKRGRDLG